MEKTDIFVGITFDSVNGKLPLTVAQKHPFVDSITRVSRFCRIIAGLVLTNYIYLGCCYYIILGE